MKNTSYRQTACRLWPRHHRRLLGVLSIVFLAYAIFTYSVYPPGLHHGLVVNVMLAMVPLLFALPIVWLNARGCRFFWGLPFWAFWLLFYPNVPYLFTDLIHIQLYEFNASLTPIPSVRAWLSLTHIVAAVGIGCIFGFYSLYLLQRMLQKKRGSIAGWALAVSASGLAALGVYIGRFLRYNSWDILQMPLLLLQDLAVLLTPRGMALSALFFVFAFGGYGLFYLCFNGPASSQET